MRQKNLRWGLRWHDGLDCQPQSFRDLFAAQFLLFDLGPVRFRWSRALLKRVVFYPGLNWKHSASAYVLERVHRCVSVAGLVCEGASSCGLVLARDLAGFSLELSSKDVTFFCIINLRHSMIKTYLDFRCK